jgi:nitroreductase
VTDKSVRNTPIDIDLSQADQLLTSARGLREDMDLERPVPRSVIIECAKVAIQAPAGTPLPTEHFLIVEEAGKKQLIANLYREACYPFLDKLDSQLDDNDPQTVETRKKFQSLRWQADIFEQIPALVFALKNGCVESTETFPQASFYGSIMPVAWSFILALRARGLGACWMSLLITKERQVAEILGIPHDVTQAAMFPVGYYKTSIQSAAMRALAPEQLHWDTWGTHDE